MDEEYSNLYRIVRNKTAHDPLALKQVKSSAAFALRNRDIAYFKRGCLINWYNNGRSRLAQQLWAVAPAMLKKNLTPQLLYQRLNLRSFPNMNRPRLKALDSIYLEDFYPESSVKFEPKKIIISHDDNYWEVEIKSPDSIEITNRILNASYIGNMHLVVTDQAQPNDPEPFYKPIIRLCNTNFEPIQIPTVVLRNKWDVQLLIFDIRNNWLNVSPDPANPVWFSVQSLPMQLKNRFKPRKDVMLRGSVLRVKSPHRLRAEPNTSSETLRVLQKNE